MASNVFEKNRKNMHCSKIDVLKQFFKKYIDNLFDKVLSVCLKTALS